MNTKVETLTTNSGESFSRGTYNAISVLVRDKDGYINASQLGNNSRRSRDYLKSERFQQICSCWSIRKQSNLAPSYTLNDAPNGYRGVYVHPDLVHFVAEWVDIDYAFTVSDIMNSINEKVHDVLEKQHSPDTVDNAKPVLKEIVKKISIKIDVDLVNNRCWGIRDDVHKLDQYEQYDLKRAIDDYNNIKNQLNQHPRDRKLQRSLDETRDKLDEWKYFIPMYHPKFEY